MDDDIILSKLSDNQVKLLNKRNDLNENNVLANLQPMNIVYGDKTGSTGFSNFFNRVENNTGSISINYVKKYENALFPDDNNLGKYSGKFLTISEFVKKANGIVIIYSRFVEGGILPIALILEHLGYTREGEKNILNNPKIINNPPKYGFSSSPKYCILTSHSDINNVMGSSSIDKLLPIINNKKNINGELIKVILMTPVASEGLSFYNARELHIVEPWYHFNKAKQIIGRGIRNCRHNNLPFEERNMTVFMHASFNNYTTETPDIHAYRISSKKLNQTEIIDKIIRDNAFDCYLMKNINYFPKDLFTFDIKLKSSQNKLIEYKIGDNQLYEPKCNHNDNKLNKDGYRYETYKHLIFNMKKIIKKLIINKLQNGKRFLEFDEIINFSNFDNNIIYQAINESIYPNNLIDNYILLQHNNGIHIVDIHEQKITKLRLISDNSNITINKKYIPDDLIIEISKNVIDTFKYINTISIYLSFNSILFNNFVNYIINTNYNLLKDEEKYIAKCFFTQGALIHKNELKLYEKYDSNIEYIGYFDIFNIESDINLYNFDTKRYKSISIKDKEFITIISNRKELIIPDMQKEKISTGIIYPKKEKEHYIHIFKILTSGTSQVKKTGIVCESLLKPIQDVILEEYKIDIPITKKKKTKIERCRIIAENMLKVDRLYLYPLYKPIN